MSIADSQHLLRAPIALETQILMPFNHFQKCIGIVLQFLSPLSIRLFLMSVQSIPPPWHNSRITCILTDRHKETFSKVASPESSRFSTLSFSPSRHTVISFRYCSQSFTDIRLFSEKYRSHIFRPAIMETTVVTAVTAIVA